MKAGHDRIVFKWRSDTRCRGLSCKDTRMIERCYFKFSVGALGVLSRLALIGCQPSPWLWGRRTTPATFNTHARARARFHRSREQSPDTTPHGQDSPSLSLSDIEIRDEDSCPSRGQIQNALHSHNRDLLIRQPPKISTPPPTAR